MLEEEQRFTEKRYAREYLGKSVKTKATECIT